MGIFNLIQTSGTGGGGQGPRGIAGRGISNIISQDNNDGSITLTIQYDDGTPDFVTTNTLVSDTLIQLQKLTLEGTNDSTKFAIKQQDETVIYKCDTVTGINIMKRLLIGDGVKKLALRDDEITMIDTSGEHFKIYSESSQELTLKSLIGTPTIRLKDSNDNEVFNMTSTAINFYPTQVIYGKLSDVGGIKMSIKDTGVSVGRNMTIDNSNLIVNNGLIDIFKVRSDSNETEVYKLLTRDIVSDGQLNFLDGNELLVMRLETDNRNLELNNTQLTMISGEDITLLNEPLTGITSILKTKTDKIIIPDTVLSITDNNDSPIMQVKTDNNVDVFNQLNVKSSGGGGTYTDFPFTTTPNQGGIHFGFQCATNNLISSTALVCTGVLDFIAQYSALVDSTCVQTGEMTAFSLTISPEGQFQFSFTAGMSGPFGFAFSPETAVQIGMSIDPPDPLKILDAGPPIGLLYFVFQISATAGTTYNFTSDGLFGNTATSDAIEITSTGINSAGNISLEGNNLNIQSTLSTFINSPDINITSADVNLDAGVLVLQSSSTTNITSSAMTIQTGSLNIINAIAEVSGITNFKKSVSVGTEEDLLFGGQMLTVYNPVTTQEVFNINPGFTYIKKLNDGGSGNLYYAIPGSGDLGFISNPSFDCSFLTWKTNKPEWRIPFTCQLVNNPYINDPTGSGVNAATTISGWTVLSISDTNTQITSEPSALHFTRQVNGNTTITYVGLPFPPSVGNDYKFRITYTVALAGANNQTVEIGLFINGVLHAPSVNKMIFSANSEYEVMSRTLVVPLLKNSIIDVRVNSDQTSVTVSNYNMLIETAC